MTLLKEFGVEGWPVIEASLEMIGATGEANGATLELAEDLLLCVPEAGDESAGHVVVKFLRWPHARVCRAATATMIRLWGDRVRPLLLAMVQSKEDVVRVAGIAGLRRLGGIDEHLVPQLEPILRGRIHAGEEVRAAAALALAHATVSARPGALALLTDCVTGHEEAGYTPDGVIVAAARSLLAIGGPSMRRVVAERAERSPEPLRLRLRGLVKDP